MVTLHVNGNTRNGVLAHSLFRWESLPWVGVLCGDGNVLELHSSDGKYNDVNVLKAITLYTLK